MSPRTYDVVLFGATGFTGRLVAEHLAQKAGPGVRWAIAGRNRDKLLAVRADVSRLAKREIPIVVADSFDPASLDALVPATRVIATTVGPFAKYGKDLAAACAQHGTHYCDITGEVTFIRGSIDDNHAAAQKSGARIVHACGFDSIPFDLGVHLLWDHARREHGVGLSSAKALVGKLRGGMSGGTIASMLALMEEAGRDRSVRRLLANPHALDPDPARRLPRSPDQRSVHFDEDTQRWTAPFVMSAVNTRVVRRSDALLTYGEGFEYQEAMSFRRGPKGFAMATAVTAGLAGALAAASIPKARALLADKVLPKPGHGPSLAAREHGSFEVFLVGHTERGPGVRPTRIEGRVSGDRDPGYDETAKMLGQSALCLAQDGASLDAPGGVLTPASAMGMHLVERLRQQGIRFDVGASSPESQRRV